MIAFAKKRIRDAGKGLAHLAGWQSAEKEVAKRLDRRELEAFVTQQIRGRYDAVQDTDNFKKYWAAADALDADSSNNRDVRAKAVQRSRYEVQNNGYADGIADSYVNDVIGKGPQLRMQTASKGFNDMVEAGWRRWTKAIQFNRKLRCMAAAKHTDGEPIPVVRRNDKLADRVELDVVLHETEQCQTPLLAYGEKGKIDGVEFDEFGNPTFYDLLNHHPGSNHHSVPLDLEPEKVPARYVLHWFKLRRPGQHRGMPETLSTLNLGASGRRWREATVNAAENIARLTLLLETAYQPNELDDVAPMSTLDIQTGMMTALPNNVKAHQPKPEHPTANHAEFNKSLLNEQARPKSMPYSRAAADHSDSNFAAGKLDSLIYMALINIDRQDCETLVLDKLFDVWFEVALVVYEWLGGNPSVISEAMKAHTWDWPQHRIADEKAKAQADEKRLQRGMVHLPTLYRESGRDYDEEAQKAAEVYGHDVDTQKKLDLAAAYGVMTTELFASLLDIKLQQQTPSSPSVDRGEVAAIAHRVALDAIEERKQEDLVYG